MNNPIRTFASILDVFSNVGNQEYYNLQAEAVSDAIEDIIADRDSKGIKGAILLGIEACVFPDLKKKNNPYWDKENQQWNLVKQVSLTGVIGFNYENSVNNRLVKENKEANFEAMPRSWGTHINSWLVEHTNKQGIYRRYLSIAICPLVHPRTEYYSVVPNLHIVDKDDLVEFEKVESEGRQGLDNKLIYRDFALDSINSISYRGIVEMRDVMRELAGEGAKSNVA